MATTYSVADPDIAEMVNARLEAAHQEMWREGVRVGVLMAYNPDGPGVSHGGYPAAAKVKVVPQKDRITKGYDAEILIDQHTWDGLEPRQRQALVAHELRHVRLSKKVVDGVLEVQRDDNDRPKLRLVAGDWNGGDGFAEIVAEFGADALEYRNARSVWAKADGAEQRGPEATLFAPPGQAK